MRVSERLGRFKENLGLGNIIPDRQIPDLPLGREGQKLPRLAHKDFRKAIIAQQVRVTRNGKLA